MANLRAWKNKLKETLIYPYDSDLDTDHPDCPRCGSTMNFHGHDDFGDFACGEGYWTCTCCDFKIKENEL